MSNQNERITRILNFVNESQDISSLSQNNTSKDSIENIYSNNSTDNNEKKTTSNDSNESKNGEHLKENKKDEIENRNIDNNTINNSNLEEYLQDDKSYRSLNRKLKKQTVYPCNINGFIFNSNDELLSFRNNLMKSKRDYNRRIKQDKISRTKLNIEDLDEILDDNIIEDSNVVYSSRNPIGISKDGKQYRIPRTNLKDRKNIFKNVSKDKSNIKKLLEIDDEEEFNKETLNNIKDETLKRKAKLHFDNDIVDDQTWNKNQFIRMMEDLMKQNKELTRRIETNEEILRNSRNTRKTTEIENVLGSQFNPKLFSKQ